MGGAGWVPRSRSSSCTGLPWHHPGAQSEVAPEPTRRCHRAAPGGCGQPEVRDNREGSRRWMGQIWGRWERQGLCQTGMGL